MLEHSDPPGADVAIEAQADVAPLDAVGSAPAAVVAPVPELSPAACAARLAELFPAVFSPGAPQPLKLRIQADIQERAPGVFSRKTLSGFLHRHTTSTAYLRALVNAPQRIDLDGAPAGEVAGEHREAATAELQRRRT
ncbi:MAG: ProQ/FinO family protein, partial [Burkholderiaceae bacterium]